MSVGYLRKREQCKVMERMLEAERAKAARLREALVKVEGDINWMLNEGRFLSPWTFEYIDKALADTAPNAPPVASELDAARARIAELEEALRDLLSRPFSKPGWNAEWDAIVGRARAALASTTPRGIGPEVASKVGRCIRASLAFQESDSLAAHNKASAELRDALALLPEPR